MTDAIRGITFTAIQRTAARGDAAFLAPPTDMQPLGIGATMIAAAGLLLLSGLGWAGAPGPPAEPAVRTEGGRPRRTAAATLGALAAAAAALFLLRSRLPPSIPHYAWPLLALAFGGWCAIALCRGRRAGLRPVVILAVAMTVFAAWRDGLWSPPAGGIAWQRYSGAVLATAAARATPVMLSFSADWCPACRQADRTTFRENALILRIDEGRVTAVRVDLTRPDPALQRVLERYGGGAIPYLVFIDGGGNVFRRMTGVPDVDAVTAAIDAMSAAR